MIKSLNIIVNTVLVFLVGYVALQVIPTLVSSNKTEDFLIGISMALICVGIIVERGSVFFNEMKEKKNVN